MKLPSIQKFINMFKDKHVIDSRRDQDHLLDEDPDKVEENENDLPRPKKVKTRKEKKSSQSSENIPYTLI